MNIGAINLNKQDYENPVHPKIETGKFKDKKVTIIESIKLFFKKIWTAIKQFFVSLYDRCIKKQSVAQPSQYSVSEPVPHNNPQASATNLQPQPIHQNIPPKPVSPSKAAEDKPQCFKLQKPAAWTTGNKQKKMPGDIYIAIMNLSLDEKVKIKQHRLSPNDWEPIFKKINQECINKPYAGQTNYKYGEDVWRPNHNGTHSARQAKLFEVLYQLIPDDIKKKNPFNNEEFNSLMLAAYCFRAGRVDESHGSQGDQYPLRSAQVYAAHAQQMGFSEKTIQWTFDIISRDFNTPLQDSGQEFAYQILDVGHRLDLQRCYSSSAIKPDIKTALNQWGLSDQTEKLLTYGQQLIKSTGCGINGGIFSLQPPDNALFTACSKDGSHCWNTVSKVKY